MKCVYCEKDDAVHFWKCLVVKRSTSVFLQQQTVEERASGMQNVGLCDKCLTKLARKHYDSTPMLRVSLLAGLIVITPIILALILDDRMPIPVIFVMMGLGFLLYLLNKYIFGPAYVRKHPARMYGYIAQDKSNQDLKPIHTIYVPVGDGLYKGDFGFSARNPSLSGGMATKVYEQAIKTGMWKAMPVSGPADFPEAEDKPLPDASDPDFLSACVNRLLYLYQKRPEGYLVSQADEVREVGKKLNEAGGMDLMLKAHALFAEKNRMMARNLEMVWDHIGSWQG